MLAPGATATLGVFVSGASGGVWKTTTLVSGGSPDQWRLSFQVLDGTSNTIMFMEQSPLFSEMAASSIVHLTPDRALRVNVANAGNAMASYTASEYDALGNLVMQMAIPNVPPGSVGQASFPGGVTDNRRVAVAGEQFSLNFATCELFDVNTGRSIIIALPLPT